MPNQVVTEHSRNTVAMSSGPNGSANAFVSDEVHPQQGPDGFGCSSYNSADNNGSFPNPEAVGLDHLEWWCCIGEVDQQW
jgi:hypothetical protein